MTRVLPFGPDGASPAGRPPPMPAVLVFLRRPRPRFPASPIRDRIRLTRVGLMLPDMPAARQALLTASWLARGLSLRTSLMNMLFPWFRVAVAGIERSPGAIIGINSPQLTRMTSEFE